MSLQFTITLLVAISLMMIVAAKRKYLAEHPPYLKRCELADVDIEHCLAKNFQVVFNEWKDGIPGLKSFGTLDPLYVKRISVSQNDNNPVAQLSFELRDVKTVGLGNVTVKNVLYDRVKRIMKFKAAGPRLNFFFDYSTKGRILQLNLNGNGNATASIDDVEMSVAYRFKRSYEDELLFHTLEKLRLEITKIGKFNLHLNNLFNGQRDLEESTNMLINENWRTFYEVLGPALSEAIEAIMIDRMKKMLDFVPINYFVNDVEVAEKGV